MSSGLFAQHLTQIAAEDEMARAKRLERAWRAYRGEYPPPLVVRRGQPDDNVRLNKSRVVVDKGVSFLFGKPLTFEIDGSGDARTPAERYLDDVWQANRRQTLLQKLALNGAICGHSFIKIIPPGGRYGPNPLEVPRLVLLNPAEMAVEWEPADIDVVVRYRHQYTGLDPVTRQPTIYRQVIEREGAFWRIADQRASPDQVQFREVNSVPWPYDFPPIVDAQNLPMPHEYYGEADLESDLLDLIESRNRVISNLARIIRFHGHPRLWGRGFGAETIKAGIDELTLLQGEHATMGALAMVENISSHLDLDRRLDEALHELSRTPAVSTGKLESIGQISGLALQILYGPLVEKTETKRSTYGDLLTELNRRLLIVGGHEAESATPVNIQWPEILPSDPKAEVDTLLGKQQLGLSQATALEQLGHDPKREQQQRQGEQEELAAQMDKALNRQTLPG